MSRLTPKTIINSGTTFENYMGYVSPNVIIEAFSAIDEYMKKVFPELKWAINDVTADIADSLDKRNQIRIIVYTNSVNDEYSSLWFYYVIESKELTSQVEMYLITDIRNKIYSCDNVLVKKATHDAYFAIYDEEDRKDGNPLFQMISSSELFAIEYPASIPKLLKLAGEYTGNGCIEIRTKDLKTGEEETLVYADNNGYRILADPEIEE